MSTPTPPQSDRDAPPPEHTTNEIVPVSVPRAVEAEARSRARQSNEALEDVLAEHVAVVPDYCFSPVEGDSVPSATTRRVALHTTVEPELAAIVDELSDDPREWIREAVREKIRWERQREIDDGGTTTDGSR